MFISEKKRRIHYTNVRHKSRNNSQNNFKTTRSGDIESFWIFFPLCTYMMKLVL